MVSEQTVEEFRNAAKDDYGVDLSFDEAREVLLGWVSYFNLLAKIDHRGRPTSEPAPM
ncbi:hypothetical protein HYW59_03295 [Candidatus Kaiserbacteria bacterium]|nr:hypothetical protein [Candidatus Kaiserbacteria bacterium]